MANYTFLDAYASVQTAESSIISAGVQRPIVNVGNLGTTSGSVVAFLGGSTNASVITVGTAVANQSVSGTVGASIIGTVPVTQVGAWSTSLVGVIPGSVVAFQGTSPFVTNFQNSSILAVPVGSVITTNIGSVIAVLQGASIVGTYAEDAAHTTADKGVFTLAVRNDAVASFASANLDYSPTGVDSAGRNVTKPFAPEESRVEGYHSVSGTSVTTLVAAAGTGLKNYITDIMLANTGAATTLVTFRSGGGTSILGYTIAPAGGGSNMNFHTPMRTLANETFDFQATTATSILFATVKGFKAP